ncbi:MAG TPA: hypothetical protein VIG06_22900 [Kofleriaceae bacterium]
MRKLRSAALGVIAILGGGCGLGLGSGDSQVTADDVDTQGGCDGGPHRGSCEASEPDLPYDVKIQCGDPVIPVVAAFREKNGPNARFAPAPGTTPDCPFLIEGAVIRADEIASCAAFVATASDATTEGNRDAGRDRVEVTWCWYQSVTSDADGDCCVPAGAAEEVQCETDHLDIRFYCDGGEGVPDGADQPFDPGSVPATCDGDGDGGDGGDECDGPETCPPDGDDAGPVD